MFTHSARVYDAIYSFKKYGVESEKIREIVAARNPSAKTLLDVACGTGTHLALLKDHFVCTGIDLDEGLLEIAREKIPGMELLQGDMTDFDLGRKFDVVTCLFGSTAYTQSKGGLQKAVHCLSKHLADSGVLIIEPFIFQDKFLDGKFGIMTAQTPDFHVARANTTKKEGDLCLLDLEYLVASAQGVDHYKETHKVALFDPEDYLDALGAVDMKVEFDPEGLMGRGTFIATRQ